MDDQVWSSDEVQYQLREAAETLRSVRLSGRDFPSLKMATWPDVVRDAAECYGYGEVTVRRTIPGPESIDRMDRALPWLLWLDKDHRRIVWARSCDIKWRKLEDIDGRSRTTLAKIYDEGIGFILVRLNRSVIAQQVGEIWGTKCAMG